MVDEILRQPSMKQIAINFIQNKGQIKDTGEITIKKTNYHKEIQNLDEQNPFEGLTPSQIIKKKKQLEAEKRDRELRESARNNVLQNRSQAQKMKHSQMRSSIDVNRAANQKNNVSTFSKSKEFYGGGTIESQNMGTGSMGQTSSNGKSKYMDDMPMEDTVYTVNLQSK